MGVRSVGCSLNPGAALRGVNHGPAAGAGSGAPGLLWWAGSPSRNPHHAPADLHKPQPSSTHTQRGCLCVRETRKSLFIDCYFVLVFCFLAVIQTCLPALPTDRVRRPLKPQPPTYKYYSADTSTGMPALACPGSGAAPGRGNPPSHPQGHAGLEKPARAQAPCAPTEGRAIKQKSRECCGLVPGVLVCGQPARECRWSL